MTDVNTLYVNSYINTTLEMLSDDLKEIVDLKTRVKILDSLVAEKEQQIIQLSNNSQMNTSLIEEAESWKKAHDTIKGLYDAVSTKASHLDVALSQIVEMKQKIKEQQDQIEELKAKPKRTPKPKVTAIDNKTTAIIKANVDDF